MENAIEKARQRLSAENAEYSTLLEKIATERVGMLQQLRQFGGCNTCKHFFEQVPEGCNYEIRCDKCSLDCECAKCIDRQNWEWCGLWEVTK